MSSLRHAPACRGLPARVPAPSKTSAHDRDAAIPSATERDGHDMVFRTVHWALASSQNDSAQFFKFLSLDIRYPFLHCGLQPSLLFCHFLMKVNCAPLTFKKKIRFPIRGKYGTHLLRTFLAPCLRDQLDPLLARSTLLIPVGNTAFGANSYWRRWHQEVLCPA